MSHAAKARQKKGAFGPLSGVNRNWCEPELV